MRPWTPDLWCKDDTEKLCPDQSINCDVIIQKYHLDLKSRIFALKISGFRVLVWGSWSFSDTLLSLWLPWLGLRSPASALCLEGTFTMDTCIWPVRFDFVSDGKINIFMEYLDGLVQGGLNSSANALEIRLSCTNPSSVIFSTSANFLSLEQQLIYAQMLNTVKYLI